MEISTGIERLFLMISNEESKALWKPNINKEIPSEMMLGWMPLSSSDSAALSSAPANTTTEVVPSPASTS